jgi:hypothetical protein
MEAENLFEKQEPAVPEANHKSQLSVGWQPFYNAFACMGMRYCLWVVTRFDFHGFILRTH